VDPSTRRPLLVSFSGLDGSGKSTQIASLTKSLRRRGLAVRTFAFWDDVVVCTRYREGFVHRVYGSEKGIGAPGRPVERCDKNVRAWYLTIARSFLYLADAIHLCWVVNKVRGSNADVIVMDRYIYDELANLPLSNPLTRAFVRFVAGLAPRPNIAYLLDADPEAALSRKPEYPVEFMRECRNSYLQLAEMLGWATLISPLPLTASIKQVENTLAPLLRHAAASNTPL